MTLNKDLMARDGSFDPVQRPKHYTTSAAQCQCGRTIECVQVTETMNFCLGNTVKYIWRADLKGSDIQDLEKAAFYLNREIARRRAQKPTKL